MRSRRARRSAPRPQRERDWLAAIEGVLQGLRQGRPGHAHAELRAGDGGAESRSIPTTSRRRSSTRWRSTRPSTTRSMAPLVKAIEILEPLDKKYPDHPGITHYLIHSYDFAPIAKRGIPAANKYAKIAPSAPHAQHMPSHIYSMVGMWDESIASNIASIKVANEYAAQAKLDGVLAGVPHSLRLHAVRLPAARSGREGEGADRRERRDQESDRRRSRRATRRAPPSPHATTSSGRTGRAPRNCSRSARPSRRPRRSRISRARWARRAAATSPPRRPTSTSSRNCAPGC